MSPVSIGLEIHLALLTDRKSFSPEKHGESSWVSLGFPGTLPFLNVEAVEQTIKLSYALGCLVNFQYVTFDRKNYFYYDLPRGYQITQHFNPLGLNGKVQLSSGKIIRIKQVHLEEDSAQQFKKSNEIRLNFFRLGRAISEIVTEPDFENYDEVEEFLRLLRQICSFNRISDASYENGEIRVDLNISVRLRQEDALNKKSEVKNLNSLLAIRKSIDYLVKFNEEKLLSGDDIESFTYMWSEKSQICKATRKKESFLGYFYIPESNIPPLEVPKARYEELISTLFVDFFGLEKKLKDEGLKEPKIRYLLGNYQIYSLVLRLNGVLEDFSSSYNWVVNVISGLVENIDWDNFPYAEVEKAILAVEQTKKISLKIAKGVIKEILVKGSTFKEAYKYLNVSLISDAATIKKLVQNAFEKYKDQIPKLKENLFKLEKLIIGECMKTSKGQADPKLVKSEFDLLISKLRDANS